MRDVEGLKKYERGFFHGKTDMSRVAKELEVFEDKHVLYDCYTSGTG